jgi:hypothetical protein
VALAFGMVIVLGILIPVLLVVYLYTGWMTCLVLNLVVIVMAIVTVVYLLYKRSKLAMRL